MKLWMLFDNGKNPLPVLLDDGDELPEPVDLIAYFRGGTFFLEEFIRAAQKMQSIPIHNYQWLGPYDIPQDVGNLPNIYDIEELHEFYSLDSPFAQLGDFVVWYVPGSENFLIEEIPTKEQCDNRYDNAQTDYLVHCYLS